MRKFENNIMLEFFSHVYMQPCTLSSLKVTCWANMAAGEQGHAHGSKYEFQSPYDA